MKEDLDLSEIERLNQQIRNLIRAQSFGSSFVRGIMSGFGYAIGATLVVALVFWVLSFLPLVPIIGSWLADIIKAAQSNLPVR